MPTAKAQIKASIFIIHFRFFFYKGPLLETLDLFYEYFGITPANLVTFSICISSLPTTLKC